MEALSRARQELDAAQKELARQRWAPPPVKYGAESAVRRAEERLAEAQKAYEAVRETQPQLIKRMEGELAKAKAELAKAPPNSAKYDEAEKAVAIAEYKLAQASKPAPAAGAIWGGKSRRRRRPRRRQTRKPKRVSSRSM